jgi:hypothetical protein
MSREMVDKGVTPVWVDFDGRIGLVGYTLDRTAAQPGQALRLTLYWQALQPVRSNYTVFVHVLGPGDRILASDDRQPADGQHPTSGWTPGQVVEDGHTLAIPDDASSGQYELEIGLYRRRTGERLAVRGGPDKDRVVLGRVRIGERQVESHWLKVERSTFNLWRIALAPQFRPARLRAGGGFPQTACDAGSGS